MTMLGWWRRRGRSFDGMVYPPVTQFETRALRLQPRLEPLRIVVADDSLLERTGTVRLLQDAGFDVVAQAADREDTLRKVRAHRPDIAVVDARLACGLRAELPGVRLLVLSAAIAESDACELLVVRPALLVVFALFHGAILRPIVRSLAIHFAAKENLKLDFQIEGSVLGGLVLKNVHATATGPSAVESINADLVRADYSLWGLIFHGMPEFLQNVELHSGSIVLNPKAEPPTPPKPDEKISLPGFFPTYPSSTTPR